MSGPGSQRLIFVDCEATGPCPGKGILTEFGAVAYGFQDTPSFHGKLYEGEVTTAPVPRLGPGTRLFNEDEVLGVFSSFERWMLALYGNRPGRFTMVSDNPAFDWQWINQYFHTLLGHNPFGFSARRIGDFYAGLVGDWARATEWKKLRETPHDHNPVNDARGNLEAFERMLRGERA